MTLKPANIHIILYFQIALCVLVTITFTRSQFNTRFKTAAAARHFYGPCRQRLNHAEVFSVVYNSVLKMILSNRYVARLCAV